MGCLAIFSIFRRSDRANVFGCSPLHFGYSEAKPSVPKAVDRAPVPVDAGEGDFGRSRHRPAPATHNPQKPPYLSAGLRSYCMQGPTAQGVLPSSHCAQWYSSPSEAR